MSANEEPNPKRVRKSKWDASAPVVSSSAAPIVQPVSLPLPLPVLNTQQNVVAQQAALQQSLALQQSFVQSNPLLSGLAGVALGTVVPAAGIQHRVYIGLDKN